MKRILFVILATLIGLIAGHAFAIEWHIANQKTIAWDPVTTLTDGTSLPAGDSVLYRIWIKRDGQINESVIADNVDMTQYTLTLDQEGRFFVGIQAIRVYTIDGQDLISESEIAWSDIPENCANSNDFGVVYLISPAKAGGLAVTD